MSSFIPLSVPNLKGNELKYVEDAIKTEWVSTGGSYINKFEGAVAEYTRVKGAVACQSGTAGLHLALIACDIKAGEEVLVPTLTFIAAVNPVKYINAHPVFMDCDDSLCMDPFKVEEFINTECEMKEGKLRNKNSNRYISAIVVVHVFGNLANMDKFCEIAKKYKLKLIEDATEALGTFRLKDGKHAGTLGDVGVYSFNGNKIITCGGGGMVVSNNIKMLSHIRHISTQAKLGDIYYDHDEIGYNYRMTNLQAAVGLAQIEQLEEFIALKNENYNYYKKSGLNLLEFDKDIRSNKWFYSYLTDNRDEIIKKCAGNKIQTRPIWKLIHTLKLYQNEQNYNIEKAYYYYEGITNIPCSTNLNLSQIERVVSVINEYGCD